MGAARLVCKSWNQFFVDEFTKTEAGKEKLEKWRMGRLVLGWRDTEANMKKIGKARDEMETLYCDNNFVFCGHEDDISVYNLSSGAWVKDLRHDVKLTDADFWGPSTAVVGNKDVVVGVIKGRVVNIWEAKQLEQVHHIDLGQFKCLQGGVQVSGTRVTILAFEELANQRGPLASLVIAEKVEEGWETRTLANLTLEHGGLVATNGHFTAVTKKGHWESGLEVKDTQIALWRGDVMHEEEVDIILPGHFGQVVTGIILEPPFIILSLCAPSEDRSGNVSIEVFSISSNPLMEEINSRGTLVKRMSLPGTKGAPAEGRFIANDFIVGYFQCQEQAEDTLVWWCEKRMLLNPEISAKNTWTRELRLPYDFSSINMNSTSLVAAKDAITFQHPGVAWTFDKPTKGDIHSINFLQKPARGVS